MDLVPDPRTHNLPLVSSPWPILTIIAIYVFAVLKLVPDFMKNRKAYDLRKFLAFYNIFQVLANSFFAFHTVHAAISGNTFHLYCEPIDRSDYPPAVKLMMMGYWLLWMKLIDLLETVIFILRRKDSQVSVLHVYHHATTPLFNWFFLRYMPGGMFYWHMVVNCCVHVIMYTYYYFSSSSSKGPTVTRILQKVKPIITLIQMAQFWLLLLHTAQGFLPSCNVSKVVCAITVSNYVINFSLFYAFYRKSYKSKAVKKQ